MKQVYIRAMKGEKGTEYGYLQIVEVQIVVAWSVANMVVCLMHLIGSPLEKVGCPSQRVCPLGSRAATISSALPIAGDQKVIYLKGRRNWCVDIC
jgi:hypothetical protein